MSLSTDTRVADRRNLTQILSPDVALELVLRSRPSTPAIEEARRISLARQAEAASVAMTDSLAVHPTRERSSDRAIRRAGFADARPSRPQMGSLGIGRGLRSGTSTTTPAGLPVRSTGSPAISAPRQRPATPSVASAGQPRSGAVASRDGRGSQPVAPIRRTANGLAGGTSRSAGRSPEPTRTAAGRPTSNAVATAGPSTRTSDRSGSSRISSSRISSGRMSSARSGGSAGEQGAAALAVAPQAVVEERTTAQVNPRTRLSTVPTPPKTRSSAVIMGVVIGGLLLVVSFSSVGLHGKLAKSQLVLDKLRSDITVEERSNQTLRVEVAELQAPQRIVAEAERMGMEPSSEVVFLNTVAPAPVNADQAAPTVPATVGR